MPTKIVTQDIANNSITGIKLAIPTTKGDLLGFNTTPSRLPVGQDGQILIADSSQNFGMRWGNNSYINTTPTTVANTTTETILTSFNSSANILKISCFGVYGTQSGNLTLKLKFGSVIVISKTLSLSNSLTNVGWNLQLNCIVASNKVESQGNSLFNGVPVNWSNTDQIAISSQEVSLTATWSSKHINNTITIRQLIVDF